jgi:hypothetical protein
MKKQPIKLELSVNTPSAGIVHVLRDCADREGFIVLEYAGEATTAQRKAAAQYLFDEGFIEFAQGKIELGELD